MRIEYGPPFPNEFKNIGLTARETMEPEVWPRDRVLLKACFGAVGGNVAPITADLVISADYQPLPLIPWRRYVLARYELQKTTDRFRWLPTGSARPFRAPGR